MAPPDQFEEDAILSGVLQELSVTPYACSSLTKLTGGTANFVYRGALTQPLVAQDGSTAGTVIIKHSTNFVAVNRDFPLDVMRCVIIPVSNSVSLRLCLDSDVFGL